MAGADGNSLSIGRFARITGVSHKALRLHDTLGLLLPSHVDPDSGCRFYGNGQVH